MIAKDFRFGNIVSVNGNFNVVITEMDCSWITYDRVDATEVVGHVEWQHLQPILLTPEILEKCGFVNWTEDEWVRYVLNPRWVHNENDSDFEVCDLELELNKDGHFYIQPQYVGTKELPVKSLHHLQNLVFYLTGKELEISL